MSKHKSFSICDAFDFGLVGNDGNCVDAGTSLSNSVSPKKLIFGLTSLMASKSQVLNREAKSKQHHRFNHDSLRNHDKDSPRPHGFCLRQNSLPIKRPGSLGSDQLNSVHQG